LLIPKLTLYLNVISYEPKNTTIMKPTIELLNLAKKKAVATFKNITAESMTSIRLTSEEQSYTIFYENGLSYIGSYKQDKLGKFFKNRKEYNLTNDKNNVIATMQPLIKLNGNSMWI